MTQNLIFSRSTMNPTIKGIVFFFGMKNVYKIYNIYKCIRKKCKVKKTREKIVFQPFGSR